MDRIQSDEAFRVWIINRLSETIGKYSILKGGMVLRVLESPRYTNDIDYVFAPLTSKKEVIPLIHKALGNLENIEFKERLHSTNISFDVKLKNQFGVFKTQIKISISESCETQSLSTGNFAIKFNQSPRIIRVMQYEVALAHKLAAWNERKLIRDLYDAYFFYRNLNILPKLKTLRERLKKINYAKNLKKKAALTQMSLKSFLEVLKENLQNLTEQTVDEELRDFLDPHLIIGLSPKIKIGLNQMIEEIHGKLCYFCDEEVLWKAQAQEKGKVFDAIEVDCPLCGSYRISGLFIGMNNLDLFSRWKEYLQNRSSVEKKERKLIATDTSLPQ